MDSEWTPRKDERYKFQSFLKQQQIQEKVDNVNKKTSNAEDEHVGAIHI